jgi:outer membrane protein
MKKQVIAAALLGVLATSSAFAQQDPLGPWQVRVRAVHLDSANKDSTGLGLGINDKWLPEVDFSYYFAPNWAAELVLTVPQKQTITSSALGAKVGTFKHLPPTLTVQYHFNPTGSIRPYVGAGLNYTRFSSAKLLPGVDIDNSSVGGALQVGVDIPLSRNMSLNLDLKKVYLDTDVRIGGVKQGTLKVNPVLLGVGVGWRF